MRCYFLIDGHIAGIEMMTGLSDRDAVAKARLLFSERRIPFDGYEVWDQTRFVFRHPNNPYVETPKPIGRARQPPLTDDRTRRDTLGPNWPWPAAGLRR
jgi:hypothetical protein